MFAYNKAIIALLTPILLDLFLKIDTNVLTPLNWSMGNDFWTGVTGLIGGYLAFRVPNVPKDS